MTTAKTLGKDINAFRVQHDKSYIVPKAIEDGLKTLGPDKWEYSEDFRKLCNLSTPDLAMFREQYADFLVTVGSKTKKTVWCGSKALATKLRAMT